MNDIEILSLTFVGKHLEFDTIYTLKFNPQQSVRFEAGQWVHLGLPTETRDKSMVRHMSFASAPDDKFIEFTMDLGSGTPYKEGLSALKAGDTVRAFKIRGEFCIDPSSTSEVVFLAGGLGITPVRAIVRNLKNKGLYAQWSLLHVARTNFLYEEELSTFPNTQCRVHHPGLDSVWETILGKSADTLFYLSGSARFVDGMKEKLLASNIQNTQIRTESFK